MAFIHSGTYKLRKSLLLKSGGVQIVEPFGRPERSSQRLGYDQVTDAKSRKHGTGKCPDVDDASFGIQALQGLQRPSFVVKLSVVVILDDHCVLAAGPCEKRKAPGERKNRAGWKLVRWRYENQHWRASAA